MPHHDHVVIAGDLRDGGDGAGKQTLHGCFFFGLDIDAIVLHLDAFQHRMRMLTKAVSDQSFADRPGQLSFIGRKLFVERLCFRCCAES